MRPTHPAHQIARIHLLLQQQRGQPHIVGGHQTVGAIHRRRMYGKPIDDAHQFRGVGRLEAQLRHLLVRIVRVPGALLRWIVPIRRRTAIDAGVQHLGATEPNAAGPQRRLGGHNAAIDAGHQSLVRFDDKPEGGHVVQNVHHVAAGRAVRVRAADNRVVRREERVAELAAQFGQHVALDGGRHHGAVDADEGQTLLVGGVLDDEGARVLAQVQALAALAHVRVAHLGDHFGAKTD